MDDRGLGGLGVKEIHLYNPSGGSPTQRAYIFVARVLVCHIRYL